MNEDMHRRCMNVCRVVQEGKECGRFPVADEAEIGALL